TALKEIISDPQGRVGAVRTSQNEEIPCQFVGLATGVKPNIDFLKNSGLNTRQGILVNSYFQTSAPNVYAIGDCAEFEQVPADGRKTIEQVWYTGRMHGETLAANFCTSPQLYAPGVWFNSAKFFEIEYQTYGVIAVEVGEDIQEFYWEHPGGKIAFRLQMDAKGKILGVLALGFRLRHEYFDRAIREGWSGLKVISTLHQANFDPEFFAPHHVAIQKSFQSQMGVNFPLPKKSLIHHLFGASS
ncbi:MAG: NAD(P)/FAD-dependent oxidoreductase, partial [Cyclobacteriaceae bacterium]|nr:NAD(P)/FAD-dependent oxidoreductase [Cyclobacteriaceae bacterium]